MIYITDLDGIKAITNSELSEDEKIQEKIYLLNRMLDQYPGNNNEKLFYFCFYNLDLKFQQEVDLLNLSNGYSQLGIAVIKKDLGVIKWLLSKGFNVDSNAASGIHVTALHVVAGPYPSMEILELLMQYNADVDKKILNPFKYSTRLGQVEAGSSPLSEAVRCGNIEIFYRLLETNKISKESLNYSYKLAKKMLNLMQTNPEKLRMYVGALDVSSAIKEICSYFDYALPSAICTKKHFEDQEISEDCFDKIMSFTYHPYMLSRIKSTISDLNYINVAANEKNMFGLFFSPIQQKLNESAIFQQYLANHSDVSHDAGALILRS